MTRHPRLAFVTGVLLLASLPSSAALATTFTRDGIVVLDSTQLLPTNDGDNPGTRWDASLTFAAPVTVNAGDTLQGSITFGARRLRLRDNGGGFFQIGQEKGFEQLEVLANAAVPPQISQTDSEVEFADIEGMPLATGAARVGGISHNGLFMQAVVNMVSTGQEFLAGGITYRLGLVSGGPFTFDGLAFLALAEEIGIEVRPLDHYLCYGTKKAKETPRFQPITMVGLTDQFESRVYDVKKPLTLCPPADKNGEGIHDADAHLRAYQLKLTKLTPRQPKDVKRTNIAVANQFHPAPNALSVDTIKADRLLVPTAKCIDAPAGSCPSPVPPLDPALHAAGHYKCYTVRTTSGTPKFTPILAVPVEEQFTNAPKLYDLKKPTRLCAAVLDKEHPPGTHTLASDPDVHLMCYRAQVTRTKPRQTKSVPVEGVLVNNQLGPERLETGKVAELCVPSTITVPPGML
jgi:hypothetical protein